MLFRSERGEQEGQPVRDRDQRNATDRGKYAAQTPAGEPGEVAGLAVERVRGDQLGGVGLVDDSRQHRLLGGREERLQY